MWNVISCYNYLSNQIDNCRRGKEYFVTHTDGLTKSWERGPDFDLHSSLSLECSHSFVMVIVIKTIYNLTIHVIGGVELDSISYHFWLVSYIYISKLIDIVSILMAFCFNSLLMGERSACKVQSQVRRHLTPHDSTANQYKSSWDNTALAL